MAISTNSIIHYTSSIEKLKGIIAEGFQLKYCAEDIILKNDKSFSGAFPMICFCDIPLSSAKKHLASYGYYGLGLTKKWASQNNLNPVIYIDSSSDIGQILHGLSEIVKKPLKPEEKYNFEFLTDFLKICSYLKNYEGPLIRGEKSEDNYRFYDEREWRYVPQKNILKDANAVSINKYIEDKEKYNNMIKHVKLESEYRQP